MIFPWYLSEKAPHMNCHCSFVSCEVLYSCRQGPPCNSMTFCWYWHIEYVRLVPVIKWGTGRTDLCLLFIKSCTLNPWTYLIVHVLRHDKFCVYTVYKGAAQGRKFVSKLYTAVLKWMSYISMLFLYRINREIFFRVRQLHRPFML